jgi:hypothetical protein
MSDVELYSEEELLDFSSQERNAIVSVCAAAAATEDFLISDEWLNDTSTQTWELETS